MRSLAFLLLLINLIFLLWQLTLLPWLPWQPTRLEKKLPVIPSSSPQLVLVQEVHKEITQGQETGSGVKIAEAKENLVENTLASENYLPKFAPLGDSPAEEAEKPEPPTERPCFQIGPFSTSSAAKEQADWLKAQTDITSVAVESRETPVVNGTWVYLPPFEKRETALKTANHLTHLGIKDHQVVTSGKFNNAISLGVYRVPESVNRRLKELEIKGYSQAKTEKRYKNETTYWLNVKISIHSNLENLRQKLNSHTINEIVCQ